MSIPPLIPRCMGPLDHPALPPLDAGEVVPVGRDRRNSTRWRGVYRTPDGAWLLVEYALLDEEDRTVLRGLTDAERSWALRPTLDSPESLLAAVVVERKGWRPVPEIESLLDPFCDDLDPDDDTTEEAAPEPVPARAGLGEQVLQFLRGGR